MTCSCPACGAKLPLEYRKNVISLAADPAVDAVILAVAGEFGVSASSITAKRRGRRPEVLARQVAAYLCSVDLDRSANRVAPAFGRHRSTIDHALRKIEDRRDDPVFDARISRLEERLAA